MAAAPTVAPPQPSATSEAKQPTELIVLAHGLRGEVEDFTYLLAELRASTPVSRGHALVHASTVNSGNTFDGIAAGGQRLADDIRRVVSAHPSLTRISMLGFSLGGLYVRYAAALLYDAKTRCVAGLQPWRLLLVAAPNLGVRTFGIYRFLPPAVCGFAHWLYGRTGSEMLLADDAALLTKMCSDQHASSDAGAEDGRAVLFVKALAAFERRFLYANIKGDFMVNYGTSALDPAVTEIFMPDDALPPPVAAAAANAPRPSPLLGRQRSAIDVAHDERGCRVCFTMEYPASPAPAATSAPPAPNAAAAPSLLRPDPAPQSDARDRDRDRNRDEVVRDMAERLRAVGWTVVGVEFPGSIPMMHNRIIAMSRGWFNTWLNRGGMRVVHHLVDNLMDGVDGHTPTFRNVSQPPTSPRPFFSQYNLAPTM